MQQRLKRRKRTFYRLSGLLALAGLALFSEAVAHAQTWNGSVSDLWSNASNWTPNTVPNSSTASVIINSTTNNPVLIDTAPTIANLTLGSTNSASLNDAESLTIAGGTSAGSLDIAGTLTLNSTGDLTDLILSGTTGSTITLSGGGTLALSNNFNNRIYSTAGNTLVNDSGNTIEGSGQLGINSSGYAFTLNNAGIINANVNGGTLQIAPTNTVTNTGTIEATNGGTLNLIGTFTNTGGLIQATGTGSVVEINGSTISGGTLTTASGGIIQNSGIASLDGTTNTLTISSGSKVNLPDGSSTTLMGTIINNGTISQKSTGDLTDLPISGAVTLSGTGVLALSDNPNNRIYGVTGSDSLTNDVNHTIEGAGQLGINSGGNGFTLTNNGTILANQSNALNIAPSGNTTNNGTFQANSGSTLFMNGTLTNYDPTTSTLTGGTYNAYSGTIQLSQADTGSGAVITTNAATLLLDGASAKIVDGSGNNILQGHFTTNASAGHFTLQNGANLTTPGDFSNAGTVKVGSGSTFKMGASGTNSYTQSAGTTQGIGTIAGNVQVNGGSIHPGDAPGLLTITSNYTQTSQGNFDVDLAGSPSSGLYGHLKVGGNATLDGTLNVSLLNGFAPTVGSTYDILDYATVNTGGTLSGQFSTLNGMTSSFDYTILYNPSMQDVLLTVTKGPAAVPGPDSLVVLGLGLSGVAVRLRRRRPSA